MDYSFPYIVLMAFFAICAFLYENYENNEKRHNLTIVVITVFFVFYAFRGYLYSDWAGYAYNLKYAEWSDIINWDITDKKAHEPGFVILCLLCKYILNEYSFLVFVCMTIDMLLFLRFMKRRDIGNYAFVFALFTAFEGLGIMFNLLRNSISIFIFLNALEYIEKREPLKYFGMCMLCLCFHFSSVLFFPLYFFLHRRLNRNVMITVCIGSFLFYISNVSVVTSIVGVLNLGGVFEQKAEDYTEMLTTSKSFGITKVIEKLGLAALVFIYYDDILKKKGRQIVVNCFTLYIFFYYVTAEFRDLSDRLSVLFCFSLWVLWMDIIKSIELRNNRILLVGVLSLYVTYMTISDVKLPIQEYDNILFGAKSQQERLKILNRTFEAE